VTKQATYRGESLTRQSKASIRNGRGLVALLVVALLLEEVELMEVKRLVGKLLGNTSKGLDLLIRLQKGDHQGADREMTEVWFS